MLQLYFFSVCLQAQHSINGTFAALKKVGLEEEEDLDAFMVEIDILAECQHPNVVQLLEAYLWEGSLWMYLEFCDGGAVDSIMVSYIASSLNLGTLIDQ